MFSKLTIAQDKENVVLLACGAFSPPTIMHTRIMEMAKEYITSKLNVHVAIGVLSPVNDKYNKEGLASSTHRLNMINAACQDSDWLESWNWECMKDEWTPTAQVVQELRRRVTGCKVFLVAGSDILTSFNVKGLWANDDVDSITKEGLIVVERDMVVPCSNALILQHLCLFNNRWNIHVVSQYVKTDISSTRIRRLLERRLCVKYLVDSRVEEYIYNNNLFLYDPLK